MNATAVSRLGWLAWVDRLRPTGPVPLGLAAQFRRNLSLYGIGAVMIAVQQWLMASRDFFVKGAVDAIDAHNDAIASHSAMLLMAVSIGAMVARLLSRVTMFTGGRNVEYELRHSLLRHIHRLGPTFFATMPAGEIMSRATSDLQQVRLLLGFGILNVVSSLFAFCSALYVMLAISWRLTLAALVMMPLLAVVMRFFSKGFYTRTRDSQAAIGRLSQRVLASLAGTQVVRCFAMEESELAAFADANEDHLDKGLRLAKLRGSIGPVMGAMSALGVLIVFWYGGALLIADKNFTTGDFVAFWLALLRLIWPMMAFGFVTAIVQRGRASYARLATIFDAEPDVVGGSLSLSEPLSGSLEVRGLSFRYGEVQVLDDVSFALPVGSSLAIVGRTGAGKSTLAALLPRLLPTAPGMVFVDGHDICDLPLDVVRGAIGYAQQDPFLFSTTVAENIGYCLEDPEKEHERVKDAAREAQVFDDIMRLPDGFDTVVGERGVQLSGGQKQRVALARALIREPPIVVLDDPLSAVDARTETAILAAIERQKARRTVILITHRVAAAQRCDQVLVLEEGRVLEKGRHDDLVASGGLYSLFAAEQEMERDLEVMSAPPQGLPGAGEGAK